MISPANEYKRLLSIDGISDIAFDVLFTKYIIENAKNENNNTELDAGSQEELALKFNGGFPLPGFMYTFIYPPSSNEITEIKIGNKKKEFIDTVPILFCFSINKDKVGGINLNMLPPLERVKFLNAFFVTYKSILSNIESETDNGKLGLNNAFITEIGSGEGSKLLTYLSKFSGANFAYAYRTYSVSKIKQIRMIDYSKWDYVPHYEPRDAFKLLTHKIIQEQYWKTLN